MKKIILLSTLFISCLQLNTLSAQAQILYGTTFNGNEAGTINEISNDGGGTINKFIPATNHLIVAKFLENFDTNETGSNASAALIKASDGKLYGVTYEGGSKGDGVIFSFDPLTSTYTMLKDFDGADGAHPYGSLTQANDGKLYGMTSEGGSYDVGVIFSFDPSSSSYSKLKDFDNANGSYPYGSLIQASNGKLYGMTSGGGKTGNGIIFSFDPSSSGYTKLKNLEYDKGAAPYGSLVQATDGKLYGVTSGGGSYDVGVIFSFDPSSSIYKKLKDFDDTNGANPLGNLIQADDEKLYGMTNAGGKNNDPNDESGSGIIFSFEPSSAGFTKLKEFDKPEGSNPYGSLIQATDGKFYGMTHSGGSSNYGVIFSFDRSSSSYTKLIDYDGTNGAYPGFGSAFIEVKGSTKAPIVEINSPANATSYTAPARIKINAIASDEDGKITKVEFYNDTTLLHTEHEAPYDCIIANAVVGHYSITAKATDNDGNVTTSEVVNISVVPNIAPTVKITSPVNGASYTAPTNIILSADAHDPDGRIIKLDFYSGNTLIFTEMAAPYYRKWFRVPVGNYSITAVATDNNGKITTSAPVAISVKTPATSMVTGNKIISSIKPANLNISPNPVAKTLNIFTEGLQADSKSAISVLSVSGVVIKTIQSNGLNKNMQLDVSSLSAGVYYIKVINGDKILYKQFIKL